MRGFKVMFIVNLAGHLGKDPETRFTPTGQKVTIFTIATNHRKGKEDVTIWVRITVWGDRFDKLLAYLKKGSGIIVTGKMNPPSSYTDKEGRTQVSLEVTAEMIEFNPFGRNEPQEGSSHQMSHAQTGQNSLDSSHSEGQFQLNQAPSYTKPFGQASSQGHSYPQSVNDDNLPF